MGFTLWTTLSFSPSFSLGKTAPESLENHLNGFQEFKGSEPQAKAWGE
jgi:hypothetical protein